MRFPLYYSLNKNIRKKDLSKAEKEKMMSVIPELSDEETEAFFMLIYEHATINGSEEKDMPYGGVQVKEGIEFNLSKIPIELRHILFKFVSMLEKKRCEKYKTISNEECTTNC